VTFEVLMAENLNSLVFSNVKSCSEVPGEECAA
jgi:hypothetical protein